MARFPRPEGAIEDVAALKEGDSIFHVLGIWPPVATDENVVVRSAVLFRDHPEFNGGTQGDLLVYDERRVGGRFVHMAFASDGNMVPGYSHNDNYVFRSREAAEAAREYLHEQWKANPDMIAEEIERREIDRTFDEAFDCEPWPDEEVA